MRSFLENEEDYFLYQNRLYAEREKATWQVLINKAQKKAAKAKQDAEKKIRHMTSLLKKSGISPEQF